MGQNQALRQGVKFGRRASFAPGQVDHTRKVADKGQARQLWCRPAERGPLYALRRASTFDGVRAKPGGLVLGVVQLAEGVAELAAMHEELEAIDELGARVVLPRERRRLVRVVLHEDGERSRAVRAIAGRLSVPLHVSPFAFDDGGGPVPRDD